jgi:RNA polymerase sigma-70 factor (ECF subfamily)
MLYRFIRRLGIDADDAHDVLQETMFTAFRHLPKLEPRQVEAWMRSTARNLVMREWRRDRRSPDTVASEDIVYYVDAVEAVPDITDEVAHAVSLRPVISGLPHQLRRVLELQIEGLTAAETGALLNMPPHQVQNAVRAVAWRLAPLYPERAAALRARATATGEVFEEFYAQGKAADRYAAALHALSNRRREVIERYVYRAMKPREIAAELRITPGNARAHLHYAFRDLESRLGLGRQEIVMELRRRRAARQQAA